MGQVPENLIGIVGDGRVARHMAEYFKLVQIPFKQWSRRQALQRRTSVSDSLAHCQTILVLIKDSEIENFIATQGWLKNRRVIHFSGSLVTDLAVGLHPLMTFGDKLYDLKTYQEIPFIGEKGSLGFKDIFPQLPNPSFEIEKSKKILYHAFCVLSGNFTTLLWKKLLDELESEFSLPPHVAFSYLKQTAKNLMEDSKGALTGPLARRDMDTIARHLKALSEDPFKEIYAAFVKAVLPEFIKW